jgi:hypothetical protein
MVMPIQFSMGPPFFQIHMARQVKLAGRHPTRWMGTVDVGIEFRWDIWVPHGDLLEFAFTGFWLAGQAANPHFSRCASFALINPRV